LGIEADFMGILILGRLGLVTTRAGDIRSHVVKDLRGKKFFTLTIKLVTSRYHSKIPNDSIFQARGENFFVCPGSPGFL
jgi:hypothetical protein